MQPFVSRVRPGAQPGQKFELPEMEVSGFRVPLVSIRTLPIDFVATPAVALQGSGTAGKVNLPTISRGRKPLVGLTGMKLIFASTAIGATKRPPSASVR